MVHGRGAKVRDNRRHKRKSLLSAAGLTLIAWGARNAPAGREYIFYAICQRERGQRHNALADLVVGVPPQDCLVPSVAFVSAIGRITSTRQKCLEPLCQLGMNFARPLGLAQHSTAIGSRRCSPSQGDSSTSGRFLIGAAPFRCDNAKALVSFQCAMRIRPGCRINDGIPDIRL